MVPGLMLSRPLPPVEGLPLPVPAGSNWMKIRALDFLFWRVPLLWRPPLHVVFCQIPGSVRTLLSTRSSLSLHGMPLSIGLGFIHPCGQPVGLIVQIAPDVSPSHAVQNIWDVYIQEVGFAPREVREQLLIACNSPDVDASWLLWSREAEASLARAYLSAGGPSLSNAGSYVGRGQLSLRTMRLGGRCRDRIYRIDRADKFDVTHSGFFVNSSLAPVLRFRRRFVSVCNVLKGINLHAFSETTVIALWHRWRAVVRMSPTGPVTSFEPWTHWIPPDLHGFYKWAMDTLALLNEFVLKVVRHRLTSRSIAWSNWIREDLASRPYKWLGPEFVPPAPYLVCKPQDSPNGSGILVQPALNDALFRKAWMPYFRREGHL